MNYCPYCKCTSCVSERANARMKAFLAGRTLQRELIRGSDPARVRLTFTEPPDPAGDLKTEGSVSTLADEMAP